jgi:hypothetical protein
VHRFRDPALHEEFAVLPVDIDVTEFHTYGVDRGGDQTVFTIDDQAIRSVDQAPDYPMQLMIGVFDFPARGDSALVPELVISHVRGHA